MAGLLTGVIGAAGSIIGGSTQASGQQAAANTQQNMFNTITAQEQPFLQGGYGAENSLNYLLGTGTVGANGQPNASQLSSSLGLPQGYLTQQFSPTEFLNSPQYQFQLQQGGQATRNADTPGLGALSGAALKDLTNYNQGLASTYYGNYFNMFQNQQNNIFDRLSGIATLGQNAAGNLGTQGSSLGRGIAQAQAGSAASLGSAYASAANNLGSSAMLYSILNNSNNGNYMHNGTTYDSSGIATYVNPGNAGQFEGDL